MIIENEYNIREVIVMLLEGCIMNFKFGKQINYHPIVQSVICGVIVALIMLIFQVSMIGVILGGIVIFLLVSFGYYPHYLAYLYGAWEISGDKIYYYDMSTYGRRLKQVFRPTQSEFQAINFEDISEMRVIQNKDQITSKSILGTWYLPELYMPWLRPKYFALVKTWDGKTINLDLSWDQMWGKQDSSTEIQSAITYLKQNHVMSTI